MKLTPAELQAPRTLPSWLGSLAAHLVVLLLLAWLLPGPPRGKSAEETDRVAGITLAQITDRQTEYWDAASKQANDSSIPASGAAAALPQQAPALPQSLPQLPDAALVRAGESATQGIAEPHLSGAGRTLLESDAGNAEILAEDAARRAKRPLARPTHVSVFGGAPVAGRSFVFVLDRSKSMGGEGLGVLRAAESELERAVAGLEPQHEFQIVAYHHQRVFLGGRSQLLPATPENKAAIGPFISGLAAFGGTNHETAILSALRLQPDVIFLLTDGGDPQLTGPQLKTIQLHDAGRTAIHCIQFGRGPLTDEFPFLRRLADANGGTHRYVDVLGLAR